MGLLDKFNRGMGAIETGLLGNATTFNPQLAQYLSPGVMDKANKDARMQLGLAMLAASESGMGFGQGMMMAQQMAGQAFQQPLQQDLQGNMQIQALEKIKQDQSRRAAQGRVVQGAGPYSDLIAAAGDEAFPTMLEAELRPNEADKAPNSYEEFMRAGGLQIEDPSARAAAYRDFLFQGKIAGATKVNVGTEGRVSEVWQDKLIPEITKQIPTFQANADKAAKSVRQLDGMITQAQKTGLTGSFAPGVIGAASFARSLGVDLAPEAVKDARTFQTSLNNAVLQWMATTGGARGYTEKETQMLMDAFTKIQDDIPSRMAILTLAREKAANDYNDSVQSLKTTRWQVDNLKSGGDGIPEMPELPAAPSPPKYFEGQTATNKQTGETLVYRGGKWVKK
jgi:hypothetical protein